MDEILRGLQHALHLLTNDAEAWRVIGLSLAISGGSVAIAAAIGVPLGVFVALRSFPGRRFVIALLNVGMGLPPVVIGLLV
ncbi:MAG TPA: tungstate transporter permease, partial [Armatimonadota bacterium]|nr:tungstate transporter permease [Armatimonadota bacterium]